MLLSIVGAVPSTVILVVTKPAEVILTVVVLSWYVAVPAVMETLKTSPVALLVLMSKTSIYDEVVIVSA